MNKIFYAMPFTGKSYEEVASERVALTKEAHSFGLDVLEQFLNIETKEAFEAHAYGPLFVAKKDHRLLKQADFVIVDYSLPSIGRDCEVIMGKEIFDKRVISIVLDEGAARHPWIRLYSDYIVKDRTEAFRLAQQLSYFPLSSEISKLTREQKDATDIKIEEHLNKDRSSIIALLPTELKLRWQKIFKQEYPTILDYSFKRLPKTIRMNPLKIEKDTFLKIAEKYGWELRALSFSPFAFRLPEQVKELPFWEYPEYKQGLFYIQELASMLPALALDPKPGEHVLDIAAAPGSKTTQMAELMRGIGKIVANDNSEERLFILKNAVQRHGLLNIETQLGDGRLLGEKYPNQFDKVMVDAPCSSEGIFRYKAHKFFEWNLLQIYRLTEIQKEILLSGFKALKPGGTLVYSTCTFGPEENEEIVHHLLMNHKDAKIEPVVFEGIKTREGFTEWEYQRFDESLSKTIRMYPQDNDSIGFYIAKISKQR